MSDVYETSDSLEIQPTLYVPFTPEASDWTFVARVRPEVEFRSIASAVEERLTQLIPGIPPPTIRRLSDVVAEPLQNLRLGVILLACFATLATIVAGLGLYATASELATARRREIAVRIALGASPNHIRRLVVWQNVRIALVALPLGAFGAWAVARSLTHWLFQVGPFDPIGFAACATFLLVVAFVAGLRPAFRTAAIDPAAALKADA